MSFPFRDGSREAVGIVAVDQGFHLVEVLLVVCDKHRTVNDCIGDRFEISVSSSADRARLGQRVPSGRVPMSLQARFPRVSRDGSRSRSEADNGGPAEV